jgi:dihydrofolate reductase
MAKVIIHATMTLDGFIARQNNEMDWAFQYGPDEKIQESMGEIGAVVMGNPGTITEDTLSYGGQVKFPQFAVTHHPRDPVTVGGLPFTFLDSLEEVVALAKAAAYSIICSQAILSLNGSSSLPPVK